jgi:hypothetical protein
MGLLARLLRSDPEQVRAKVAHQSDNGPLSPLWQQKFGGVVSEPCRGLNRRPSHDDQREDVLDDGAATRLRTRAGRLNPVVDECTDWEHPPALGILLIACDPRQLAAFRASGYEDPGPPTVHVDVVDPSRPETGPPIVRPFAATPFANASTPGGWRP